MNWRRITGSVLTALLLLANGLPAKCGECPKVAATDACTEKHIAENHLAGHNTARQHVTDAKCETCDDQSQLARNTIEIQDSALTLSRASLHMAVAAASPGRDTAKTQVVQDSGSTFSNSLPVNPPEHALVVVLKI